MISYEKILKAGRILTSRAHEYCRYEPGYLFETE
jgi:hypothetical protein